MEAREVTQRVQPMTTPTKDPEKMGSVSARPSGALYPMSENEGLPERTTGPAATEVEPLPSDALSEDWLKEVGFYSSQQERQPFKHWKLLLGRAVDGGMFSCPADLYVEVTPAWWINSGGARVQAGVGNPWHCWIGGDQRGFVHVRHLQTRDELVRLIVGMTGLAWRSEDVMYGMLHTPKRGGELRAEEADRLAREAAREHSSPRQVAQPIRDETQVGPSTPGETR